MSLRPLGDRIIVQRLQAEETSPGGIIIPTAAQEKSQKGVVVAVGKGKMLDDGSIRPMEVKVSDIVLIGKYAGQEIKIDNEEYLLLREEEVLGVIDE